MVFGGGHASSQTTKTPSQSSALAPIATPTLAETTARITSQFFSPRAATNMSAPGRVVLSGPDAPDPFVLVDGAAQYLYTSNGTLTTVNVPAYTLLPDNRFGDRTDVLPTLPPWSFGGFTWAPDVREVKGGWALYFTAAVRGAEPPMQCIGDAFGSDPLGPFRPAPQELICQRDHRGSIDPRTFVDAGGNLWLYWKSDDNAYPQIPWTTGRGVAGIYAQRLSANGKELLGKPRLVLQPTLRWERTIAEAPDMVLEQGRYWMFYSANWFNSTAYAIGVARCEGPIGPCPPTSSEPLLASNSQGLGPGEPSVFEDSGGFFMLYNPWKSNDPDPTPNRPVVITRIGFTSTGAYLAAS
jgi:GH43 family beta-xylosidase